MTRWDNPANLGCLAAAYAECGRFDEAVHWQRKSLEKAPSQKKEVCQKRLELYQARRPFRQGPRFELVPPNSEEPVLTRVAGK